MRVYRAYDDIAHYVSISDANRHPALTYAATIHHGLDLAQFTLGTGDGGYLLFLGRIHPDKGTHLAIEVAAAAGHAARHRRRGARRGLLPARSSRRTSTATPCATSGPVGPAERDRLLGGRRRVAAPHRLRGAVRAVRGRGARCGHAGDRDAARVAARAGAARRTGFLVDDADGAVAAVGRLPTIDRRACRLEAETRFSADRMVDDYERLFHGVVASGRGRRPPAA